MRPRGILSVILLMISISAGAQSRFFKSNSIGMPLDELTEYRSDEFVYVLEISTQGESEIRVLWKSGDEKKRWESRKKGQLTITRLYLKNKLTSETYTIDGRVTKETLYESGEIQSASHYQYDGDDLLSITTRDPQGELLSTSRYERTSTGKLRSVTSEEGVSSRTSSYVYGNGVLVQEWHGEGQEGSLLRYTDSALLSDEMWTPDGIVEVTEYEYGDTVVSRYLDVAREIEEYIQRDLQDRLIFKRRVAAGILVEEQSYSYTGDKLALMTTRTPEGEETVVYEYSNDELLSETFTKNGQISILRMYFAQESYIEDIYKDGIPFIRFTYEEGIRISEEDLTEE